MPHSDRVLEILANLNYLKPNSDYIESEALVRAIIVNLPRATRAEAASDRTGRFTALSGEMLPKIFGIDPDTEEMSVIFELTEIYQIFASVRADGPVQISLNGNGRSFLANIDTVRNGQKFRSARYITDDPVAVKKLNMDRIGRAIAGVRTANKMRTLTITRQPELAGEVNNMFAAGLQEIAMLMAPVNPPTSALPAPAPESPTPTPPATDEPPATDTTQGKDK